MCQATTLTSRTQEADQIEVGGVIYETKGPDRTCVKKASHARWLCSDTGFRTAFSPKFFERAKFTSWDLLRVWAKSVVVLYYELFGLGKPDCVCDVANTSVQYFI